jgi:hypothetical protein
MYELRGLQVGQRGVHAMGPLYLPEYGVGED